LTYLECLADIVDHIRDRLERWVVAVEERLEAEHDVVPALGGLEESPRRIPRVVARLVPVEGLQDGKLGTVALHTSQDQGRRSTGGLARVRFDEHLTGAKTGI
jgi:hypothetical protein